ncbi:multidrug DMT transporter permease [Pseudidiomarina aestuarii]|uniref:Multidrug DMT transporter permease n=1 Tax=Pseudidiomarina aestuarii TaxID=624146 RepID=A0A7Z6ZS41_9GAMM|nr:helix-turn-helix domain-containing protein [Pseudidiomarina aestuarii]RUO39244.1 multidrug DMT transporter permease [Pseudidiomarina aestuarii]
MKTYDLTQAASYLKMSESYLGELARSKKIKAAKPGKRWVFLEKDLVEYLDALYSLGVNTPQQGCDGEDSSWHCTNVGTSGGLASRLQTVKEYNKLLALKTRSRHKSTKIT